MSGIDFNKRSFAHFSCFFDFFPTCEKQSPSVSSWNQGFFFAILGRGPRAFQIGKISAVNHYFGKFSKQTRTAFLVSLKTKFAIRHTIAIKLKENRMQFW